MKWNIKDVFMRFGQNKKPIQNGTDLVDNLTSLDVFAKQYAFCNIEIDGTEYELAVYGRSRIFF